MEPSEAGSPKIAIIAGTLLTVLAIVSLISGYFSNSWQMARGKIISSKVVSDEGHFARVKYEYMVGGIRYTGHSISNADGVPMSIEGAEITVDKYYPGREVDVYYDPGTPDRAVLEKGISGGSYLPLALGLFFLIVGILEIRDKTRKMHFNG